MAAKQNSDERNLNITLKQEEHSSEHDVVISLPTIWKKLKKYFLAWLMVAVIIGGLIAGISIFFSTTSSTPVRALVSFSYDGIEKGKNPDGTDFDPMSLKSPKVLEKALNACGMDLQLTETIRQGLDVDGLIPADAMERMTAYGEVFQSATNGQLSAVQQILDTSWNATQFRLTLNFREAGLTRSEAVNLLNAITDAYRDVFFENYGYNEALGSALSATKYTDYDYPQAVDAMETTLSQLNRYVNGLSSTDTARFRSTVTGFTFADLRESINSVESIDLALVTSFINTNNVTKDKERAKAYYEYRIQQLELTQKASEEQLATISETIEAYERGDVFIFGAGTDDTNMQTKEDSEQYDRMVAQKLSVTADLADTKRTIEYYKDRLQALKQNTVGGSSKAKIVEEDLEKIDEKINQLVKLVNETADDYYQNLSLSNAYNVLVPASSDAKTTITNGISAALMPIFGVEALLFVAYLIVVFSQAIKEDYANQLEKVRAKRKAEKDYEGHDEESAKAE